MSLFVHDDQRGERGQHHGKQDERPGHVEHEGEAGVEEVRPTYIGLRVNRYGPLITSSRAGRSGMMGVRARANVDSPQNVSGEADRDRGDAKDRLRQRRTFAVNLEPQKVLEQPGHEESGHEDEWRGKPDRRTAFIDHERGLYAGSGRCS